MKNRDNQQERLNDQDENWLQKIKTKPDWIWYIVGFCDGEGSLNVSFRPRQDYKCGWKITPVFNVSQKEKTILARLKSFFECGTLRDRKDGVWYYEVSNQQMLRSRILPFFQIYQFRTEKKLRDFQAFINICKILDEPDWDSIPHVQQILENREKMMVLRKRKYSSEFILKTIKSSETTCQTLSNDDQSFEEMI